MVETNLTHIRILPRLGDEFPLISHTSWASFVFGLIFSSPIWVFCCYLKCTFEVFYLLHDFFLSPEFSSRLLLLKCGKCFIIQSLTPIPMRIQIPIASTPTLSNSSLGPHVVSVAKCFFGRRWWYQSRGAGCVICVWLLWTGHKRKLKKSEQNTYFLCYLYLLQFERISWVILFVRFFIYQGAVSNCIELRPPIPESEIYGHLLSFFGLVLLWLLLVDLGTTFMMMRFGP